jgi:uncharacterized protein
MGRHQLILLPYFSFAKARLVAQYIGRVMVFLRPTFLIDGDVTDIDLDHLRQEGIKGIILDLDSTLVAPRSAKLTTAAAEWLDRAKAGFSVAIVSNNKREEYLKTVEGVLAMPVVGNARKPSRRAIRVVLKAMNLAPNEAVLVGDRPLTDVWAGMRVGMKTILVHPLKTMNEPGWIKLIRRMERLFIRN